MGCNLYCGPVFDFEDGIHLLGTNVYLDSRRGRDRGIVTHAHGDHVGPHRRIVASPATAALCARRWNAPEVEAHPFHAAWEENGARVTLLPAGHILGSAMVLLERAGTRVLYTGDFRLRPGATPECAAPEPADVLVMECTYGHPRYRFPDREEVLDRLCDFIARTVARGAVPVLIAYSLGKAQEVAGLLERRAVRVRLHPDAHRMAEIYREHGVPLACGHVEQDAAGGSAVIVPPGPKGRAVARLFRRRSVALLTGWAMDPWRRGSYAEAFPLSDHADFDELLELVETVRPRKVFTLHGPESFARRLRARGYDAEPAAVAMQGALF